MAARKRKKIRKLRGSHTHGYGSKKKHRGGGSRGGRGFSRMRKINVDKGFYSLKKKDRTINIREIVMLSEEKEGNEIDLTKLGYDKLLSGGNVSEPLTVKVKKFSKKAKNKIEKAGGKIIE